MVRAGCSNAYFRPQFVTELRAADLERLKIPSEFMMHIEEGEGKNRAVASVLSPVHRKPWMIRLIKDHSETFFKTGWHEFSRFHNLEAGFKLVFRYEGNMIFTVKVFNLNGCLKNYNQDAPAILRRIGFNDCSEEPPDGSVKSLEHPSSEDSPEESASLLEIEVPSSSRKCTKRKHDTVLEKKTTHDDGSNSGVELQTASKSCVKKRARNFIYTSHQTHKTRMSSYNIDSFLPLPKKFGSKPPCNLEKGKIKVRNDKQEIWKVQFNDTSSGYNNLCAGWRAFCLENNIETDDTCTLTITAHNEMLVSVSKAAEIDEEVDVKPDL